MTSVGAFYGTESKLLQRVYIPHADDLEIDHQPIFPGEALLKVKLETYRQGGQAAVQALLGPPAFSGRCAVVDGTNKVIDHIMADPAVYRDPTAQVIPRGGQLIPHDHTNIGDIWDGEKFNRLYIELDGLTGKVVAAAALQPIDFVTPKLSPNNIMCNASTAPNALPGATVPLLTAKIVARGRQQP